MAFDFKNQKVIRLRIKHGVTEISFCRTTFHCENVGLAIDGTKYHVGDIYGEYILKGDLLWTPSMSKGLGKREFDKFKNAYNELVTLYSAFPCLPKNYIGWYQQRYSKD